VKQDSFDLIDMLSERKKQPNYITIDVAHAHCLNVRKIIEYTRESLGDTVYIIAGNVCTPEGVKALSAWGADAVKVGVGQGSPCTTKDKTGFTMPMFSCVLECSNQLDVFGNKIPIIADGGIKHSGDIAKALVAGADMVMTGKLFARCSDSPADTIITDKGKQKIYYGSASEENKGHSRNIEGIKKCLCVDSMTYVEKINEIKQDLQSSISYAGGSSLDVLSLDNVRYRVNH
jgi:GMP reductase